MDTNEAKVKLAEIESKCKVWCAFFRYCALVVCCALVISGMTKIVENSPDQINAFSKVVETVVISVKVNIVIPWLLFSLACIACFILESGRRRAIKKLGEMRKQVEKDDPDRQTSGLTETGETPKAELWN